MSLFSADKGIVLEGKHLFGTDITPVEGAVREAIAKLGVDLFPDRTHLKYLHRGFGRRGMGTYTLQFADDVFCFGERFAVVAEHIISEDKENDYIEVSLRLDGRDWDLDMFTTESTRLIPHSFYLRLPERWERDVLLDSPEYQRQYSAFNALLMEKMEDLTETIHKNMLY